MSPSHTDDVLSELCTFITSLVGQRCLEDSDLRGLGVDSIAFLELVIFIEKRFKVPFPLELITSHSLTTPALVAHHVVALLARNKTA